MGIKEIDEKLGSLNKNMARINTWIQDNPQVQDPNAYEIIDCNVTYAEITREIKEYYDANGYPNILDEHGIPVAATWFDIPRLHPLLSDCFLGLLKMEELRDVDNHPFFNIPAVSKMFCGLKLSQFCLYSLPEDISMRKIKRELLCKSMSVPFYIWQVKRENSNYKYDNREEFESMQDMFNLYQESCTDCQFKKQLEALFMSIRKNYKYSDESIKDKPVVYHK